MSSRLVNPLGRGAAKTFRERWYAKEAIPLYVVIALGMGACGFQLTRMAFFGPDCLYDKKRRSSGMPDELTSEQQGDRYHNHMIRRALHGHKLGILPDWPNRSEQQESRH